MILAFRLQIGITELYRRNPSEIATERNRFAPSEYTRLKTLLHMVDAFRTANSRNRDVVLLCQLVMRTISRLRNDEELAFYAQRLKPVIASLMLSPHGREFVHYPASFENSSVSIMELLDLALPDRERKKTEIPENELEETKKIFFALEQFFSFQIVKSYPSIALAGNLLMQNIRWDYEQKNEQEFVKKVAVLQRLFDSYNIHYHEAIQVAEFFQNPTKIFQ